jgi:hypothetical protein
MMTHGRSGYSFGCRCEECITGNRDYARAYRARMRAQGYVYNRGRLRRPSPRRSAVTVETPVATLL